MSDKPKSGWTDRQRLAYLFNLIESSNVKLDYANAPRPDGKSVGACRIMIDRLKGTLKDELETLRNGKEVVDGRGMSRRGGAGRKRKVESDDGGEGGEGGTPKKKNKNKKEGGRGIKVEERIEGEQNGVEDDEEMMSFKGENGFDEED